MMHNTLSHKITHYSIIFRKCRPKPYPSTPKLKFIIFIPVIHNILTSLIFHCDILLFLIFAIVVIYQ